MKSLNGYVVLEIETGSSVERERRPERIDAAASRLGVKSAKEETKEGRAECVNKTVAISGLLRLLLSISRK